MIFLILNLFLAVFLIGETVYVDRLESKKFDGTNPAVSNVLLLSINVALFTVFYCTKDFVTPSLFTLMMRCCLMIEGCMLVNIAFCFPYYAWKYSSGFIYIIKLVLYIVVGYFVFFKFKRISVNLKQGFFIQCDYLVEGIARRYLNWKWCDLFDAIFKYLIPFAGCFAMLVKNESKSTKLDRHKGYVYTTGLATMWLLDISLKTVSRISPSYGLLHYFAYVPMLVILPYASTLTQAPSGRGLISFHVKAVFFYLIPSSLAGVAFMWIFHLGTDYGVSLAAVGIVVLGVIFFVGRLAVRPLEKIGRKFIHSADYAQNFEKDLASIDYSGDMDVIANDMYKIFNKNVEASSMAVYINGGNNSFECAYTSTGKKTKIDEYEVLFESLLNVGKNVVIYNEIDSLHSLAGMKRQLEKFFKNSSSDAVILLNEGRDIHGIILLGAKAGNDHYKDYDLNVFTTLYSYFFVFGYYMRNIASKEIIGTVNRELKMSSQIITSIQENMDSVKHAKMDAGCIMVPAHNIGGEFVDMIRLTDSRHLFVVGDLSGKGIAASMSMVILKAIIRSYLAETHNFKQLVVKVNQFVRDNLQKGTIFAGMFAIVDFENDTMYYINCGIPAIFLYTEVYNNVIEIQGGGHILGFVKDISPYISVKQIKLHKNDIVLTCTDGLIESHSLRGEQFGKDRIQRNMVANAMYPANRMARFSYDELVRFMSHEMEDDVSVLVLKYLSDNESEKAKLEEENSEKSELSQNVPSDTDAFTDDSSFDDTASVNDSENDNNSENTLEDDENSDLSDVTGTENGAGNRESAGETLSVEEVEEDWEDAPVFEEMEDDYVEVRRKEPDENFSESQTAPSSDNSSGTENNSDSSLYASPDDSPSLSRDNDSNKPGDDDFDVDSLLAGIELPE